MSDSLHFRTVLVAVDGSAGGQRALTLAAGLASASGATLHVVTVEDLPAVLMDGAASPGMIEALQQALASTTAGCQVAAEAAAARAGVEMEFHTIRMGMPPGPAIRELADTVDADVVVVGSRGHGPIRSVLLGSVSTYLIHHADRRILVDRLPVREDEDGFDDHQTGAAGGVDAAGEGTTP